MYISIFSDIFDSSVERLYRFCSSGTTVIGELQICSRLDPWNDLKLYRQVKIVKLDVLNRTNFVFGHLFVIKSLI